MCRSSTVFAYAWSRAHEAWLGRLTFEQFADGIVFEDYRATVAATAECLNLLDGSAR